jgi:hypothetical protein
VALLYPDISHDFYIELMKHARDELGMAMLFKDDLASSGSGRSDCEAGAWGVDGTYGCTHPE